MQLLLSLLFQAVGGLLLALAGFIWLSYDYPNVNPFFPGAIFSPGMLGQVLNWSLVVIVAAPGMKLFLVGRTKWKKWREALSASTT